MYVYGFGMWKFSYACAISLQKITHTTINCLFFFFFFFPIPVFSVFLRLITYFFFQYKLLFSFCAVLTLHANSFRGERQEFHRESATSKQVFPLPPSFWKWSKSTKIRVNGEAKIKLTKTFVNLLPFLWPLPHPGLMSRRAYCRAIPHPKFLQRVILLVK